MKKNKLIKMISCFLCTFSFLVSSSYVNAINAYAFDNKEEDSYLDVYLEMQADEDGTELPDDVEKELNESGLFDDEIESLPENVKRDLENGAEYEVQIFYTNVIENVDGSCKAEALTDDEISDYIYEEYGDEIQVYEEENESMVSKLFEKEKVRANTVCKQDSQTVSNKFKHSLMIEKNSNKSYYTVTYIANWTSAPYYKFNDLMGFTVQNGELVDTESVNSYIWAKCEYTMFGKTYSSSKTLAMKKIEHNVNQLGAQADLYSASSIFGNVGFTNAYMVLSGRFYKKGNSFSATSEYQHQKVSKTLSWGLSGSTTGAVTFSMNASTKKTMEKLLPNCYKKWS